MLNPNYTFDNFFIDDNNCFAYKVALKVSEGRGQNYLPLCLYGESQTGKTHLLHAIGNHALTINDSLRIVHLTTQGFIGELINSIINNRFKLFTYRYRYIDILLLDDIHDISGMTAMQESLYIILDTLLQSGKMIITTSNKNPIQIPHLEKRIISNLIGGVHAKTA